MSDDKVTIKVAGKVFVDWPSVRISASVENAARSFTVTATAPQSDTPAPLDIYIGDSVQVFIGEAPRELVVTGYVDEVAPSYSAGEQKVSIVGRSKTADLCDCTSVAPRRQSRRTYAQIAQTLVQPFGIEVVLDGVDTKPLRRFVIEPDEKVFDALERAGRLQSLLFYDDAQGRLIIQRAAPGSFILRKEGTLQRGVNVLACDATFNGADLYSQYTIKGQTFGDDESFGDTVAGVEAVHNDEGIARFRPLTIVSDSSLTKKKARSRARWEAAVRLGKACSAGYRVAGWRDSGGALWTPGVLVPVIDPWARIDRNMLIASVDFMLDEKTGRQTQLLVGPEAAFYGETVFDGTERKGLGAWR